MDLMVSHLPHSGAPLRKWDYSNTLFLKQCGNFISRRIAVKWRKRKVSQMKVLVLCWKWNFLNVIFLPSFAPLTVCISIIWIIKFKSIKWSELTNSLAAWSGQIREDIKTQGGSYFVTTVLNYPKIFCFNVHITQLWIFISNERKKFLDLGKLEEWSPISFDECLFIQLLS